MCAASVAQVSVKASDATSATGMRMTVRSVWPGSAAGDRGDDGAVVTQRKADERAHRSGDDEN